MEVYRENSTGQHIKEGIRNPPLKNGVTGKGSIFRIADKTEELAFLNCH